MQIQDTLHEIDGLLAQYRPFGDSDYLQGQLEIRYKRRFETIAARLPVAGELSRALDLADPRRRYRVIGDPVVRHTVQQALRHIVKGTQDGLSLAECEDVFRETLVRLELGKHGGPTEPAVSDVARLGPEPCHGWIWSEERRHDAFGRSFRRVVQDNFQSEQIRSPRPTDLAKLAKGAALLAVVLPLCSRSALGHAHVVVLFDGQKASCSDFRVGGAILMNREMLENPWWVAEHLLHEALHQKLYDFRHTHSLLARDLSRELSASTQSPPTIGSIWNVETPDRSSQWDAFRAIAAFHVYVHVALFWLETERRTADLATQFDAPAGSFPATTNRRQAFQRAQYLGKRLKDSLWQELGPAGRLLVDWLISILDKIAPFPPPPESYFIHLLLDRYVTEATLVVGKQPSPELSRELLKLIHDEAEVIRDVLAATSADRTDVDRLNEAVARHPDDSAGVAFLRFRTAVAGVVRALSPDGYALGTASSTGSAPLDERVRARIARSSEQLVEVLSR